MNKQITIDICVDPVNNSFCGESCKFLKFNYITSNASRATCELFSPFTPLMIDNSPIIFGDLIKYKRDIKCIGGTINED